MVRILKVRQVATWVTMSSLFVGMAISKWLPAEIGVTLFILAIFGVFVAAFAQGWIWTGKIADQVRMAKLLGSWVRKEGTQ